MENRILAASSEASPGAVRSAERAIGPRYSAYLEEAQRLIRACSEVIREDGHLDPRVSDIVRRAGLSNKAFYRHFRSKEELLLAVLEEGMRDGLEQVEQIMPRSGSAEERVRVWLSVLLAQALEPDHAAGLRPLVLYSARLTDDLADQLWRTVERVRGLLEQALEDGRESGEFPHIDPKLEADTVYHLAVGWLQGKVISVEPPTREQAENVIEFAIAGLRRIR